MKICLMLQLLSQITPHNTRYDSVCISSILYSQKMISLGSWLIACCKLAPTLARQMWRHNYFIDRNEYLIFTFSESINPWVYSLQFLFKSTNNSWRYERKYEWVFFFWTQCIRNVLHFLVIVGLLSGFKDTTPWAIKKCHFIWDHNSHVSGWIFTLLAPIETGKNTLSGNYKICNFTIIVSLH